MNKILCLIFFKPSQIKAKTQENGAIISSELSCKPKQKWQTMSETNN